jgi:CheY-like chemotaxis protein
MNMRMMAVSLRASLLHVDVEICQRSDGIAGLDAVRSAAASGLPFDVVLLDGEMPELDGYGMVTAMRREGLNTPVIGVTGNALPDDVQVR